MFVLSNGNRDDDVLLTELCRMNDVPDVLISHGSHVLPKNEHEKIEWGEHGMSFLRAPFSHLALQTPLAEDYLKVFPSKCEIIKTGPLIWGKIDDFRKREIVLKKYFDTKSIGENTKIIVHAGTPKASNSLRFYVFETMDEYIQSLCEIANVIEQLPDTLLIIKFRPGEGLDVNALRQLVPFSDKVVLSVNDSLLNVLSISDLLISFSSTSIEEALQNKIPVLLYGGGGRYQHVSTTEIKPNKSIKESAVYFVKQAEYLGYGVSKIFELNSVGKEELFSPYVYSVSIRQTIVENCSKFQKNN